MKENTKVKDICTIKTGKGFNDGIYWDVNMHFELRNSEGILIDERFEHNTVTTYAKNAIADQLLASPTLTKPTHMGLGTGTGGTTSLTSEFSGGGYSRSAFTSMTRSGSVITMVSNFAAGNGTGAITEAGIFDAATSGSLFCYNSFSVLNKAAGDSLSINWSLTVS